MVITNFPKSAERYFINHDRKTTVKLLKIFLDDGYQFIVRDPDSSHLNLFSVKPKKYMDTKSWGYRDADINTARMMESIKNTDITEIRWENRQPTDLGQFIKDNEVEENERDKV